MFYTLYISIYQYLSVQQLFWHHDVFFARGQHNDHHLPARPGGPGSVSRGLKVKSPNFRMGPKKPDDVDDLVRPRCGNAARWGEVFSFVNYSNLYLECEIAQQVRRTIGFWTFFYWSKKCGRRTQTDVFFEKGNPPNSNSDLLGSLGSQSAKSADQAIQRMDQDLPQITIEHGHL